MSIHFDRFLNNFLTALQPSLSQNVVAIQATANVSMIISNKNFQGVSIASRTTTDIPPIRIQSKSSILLIRCIMIVSLFFRTNVTLVSAWSHFPYLITPTIECLYFRFRDKSALNEVRFNAFWCNKAERF